MKSMTKAMRRTVLPLILLLATGCRGADTVDSTAATRTPIPSEAHETASGGITALATILPARRVTVGFQTLVVRERRHEKDVAATPVPRLRDDLLLPHSP